VAGQSGNKANSAFNLSLTWQQARAELCQAQVKLGLAKIEGKGKGNFSVEHLC
jgi:hypothetical protein